MTNDEQGERSEERASDSELKTLKAKHANSSSGDTAYQEGKRHRPETSGKSNKRPSFNFMQKLTLSEWLTLLVGSGTLVIAFLAWRTAADTSQMEEAVRGLTRLAIQTKRQADALNAQVNSMSGQANTMAEEFREMKTQTADLAIEAKGVETQIGISTRSC